MDYGLNVLLQVHIMKIIIVDKDKTKSPIELMFNEI